MNIEGRLQISLHPVAEQLNRVSIQSSRPLQAAKIFTGKTPQEVLKQLPLLFRVCGVAQASAAIQAIQQALVIEATTSIDSARIFLVQMETAREHLWRILIDWPALLGEPVDGRLMASIQPMLSILRNALFLDGDAFSLHAKFQPDQRTLHEQIDHLDRKLADLVFGCATQQWLYIKDVDALADWSDQTESIAALLVRRVIHHGWQGIAATEDKFLPTLTETALNEQLQSSDADQFIAAPMWQNENYETTALARLQGNDLIQSVSREYGNGVLTRLAARLVELAEIPAIMRVLAAELTNNKSAMLSSTLPAGTGIGQVEAARGRLVHRVVIDDGQVGSYQILAPTEWNFHPAGVVVHGLERLPGKDEKTLRQQAALLINTIDPCVGYDLQVT